MGIYNRKQYWKYLLMLLAIGIGGFSLYFTNRLVDQIAKEERKKIELWSEATRKLGEADVSYEHLDFLLQVIQNNNNIPVILTDKDDHILSYRNLDSAAVENDSTFLQKELLDMKHGKKHIKILLYADTYNYIYYRDSLLLKQLTYFPFIQLALAMFFLFVSYLAFSSSRRAEQNQVWVGLSKETAHQLGTPTSSLLAWVELFKEKKVEPELTDEMEKDVKRLEIVTARFSSIGSKPKLKETNIKDVVNSVVDYLQNRVSGKISIRSELPITDVFVPLNTALFEWVIENLCKNSVDAISDEGEVVISVSANTKHLFLDIKDTGKGISRGKFKTIFKPGFTTKSRGWGLGLSLAKRIVEEYHHGKIYVLQSEVNKGTTIRIELKK